MMLFFKFEGKKRTGVVRAIAAGVLLGGLLGGVWRASGPELAQDAASHTRKWLQTGTLPTDRNTVAIYRNVSVADMLQELEVIHEVLQSDARTALLASSIETLIVELRRSFQEDLSHSYHHLSPSRREAYNEVALLIVDLRVLVFEMARREKEAART